MFNVIDTKKKGWISEAELNRTIANYWFMQDLNSPFNNLFGKIDVKNFEAAEVALSPRSEKKGFF